jgi:cytidylate kinase
VAIERTDLIALDGPAGAGKTTLGHWLADHLDLAYFETGLLYRAAAFQALAQNLGEDKWDGALLSDLEVTPRLPGGRVADLQRLILPDRVLDIESDLSSARVDAIVPLVASVPSIREAVRSICREAIDRMPLIASGRDVGRAIIPEAPHKLFLTADPALRSARLERRSNQDRDESGGSPQLQPGGRQTLEAKVLKPHLEPAGDALVIDTSSLTVEQVRSAALRYLTRDD